MTYLFVALVVGLAAAAQATSGFGFSLIAVSPLPVLVGSKTGVVANDIIATGLVIMMAVRNRHGVDRRTVVVTSAAALAAMPLGLLVLTTVDEGRWP